ncbi:hypothetical protein [Winogradskyella sp. A3E31]|uniref:hypothetical protein n=1 Tax=Winogradskyella sp. A3E31 TaxID=3349637 RepID=UPI00398BA4F1
MNRVLIILSIGFIIFSCKPSFNLVNEKPLIENLVSGDYTNDDYLKNLPNNFKDSLPQEKLFKHLDSLHNGFDSLFYKASDLINQNVKIEKLSSTKRIDDYYFKIVEYSNSIKVQKNKKNFYLYDFKQFLNQNLIDYEDNIYKLDSHLETKLNGKILAYWGKESGKWKYLAYNDLLNEGLFGLRIAQNIIDLYFDDIFVASKIKWDKESISIFREIYEEERNNYIEDGIDFEKFLKCRIKYLEKAEEDFNYDIPDEYYESAYVFNHSIKCRIYSKKLTNNN